MCVITGNTKNANIDIETGIYVVPLTTLKSQTIMAFFDKINLEI